MRIFLFATPQPATNKNLKQNGVLKQQCFYTLSYEKSTMPLNAKKLQGILQAPLLKPFQENALFVLPRKNLVTPWSSKAQEILKSCQINLRTIEHGNAYYFDPARNANLSALQKGELFQIYDPMNQVFFQSFSNVFKFTQEAETHKNDAFQNIALSI